MGKKFKFKSQKPKEKWRLLGVAEADGAERVKGSHLEIFSNREITVEGCMGVLEYSDTYLKLKLTKGSLIICGCDFDIAAFENTTITARGRISSVEFCI